jgi:hypothetical protein
LLYPLLGVMKCKTQRIYIKNQILVLSIWRLKKCFEGVEIGKLFWVQNKVLVNIYLSNRLKTHCMFHLGRKCKPKNLQKSYFVLSILGLKKKCFERCWKIVGKLLDNKITWKHIYLWNVSEHCYISSRGGLWTNPNNLQKSKLFCRS